MGDDTASRSMQRSALGLGDWLDPIHDQPFHVVDPQQGSRKSEAIVGELRHHRLLAAAVASAAPTGAARFSNSSAIASTSLRSMTGTFACGNAMSEAIATMCGSSG